jgi:hypothetical protein
MTYRYQERKKRKKDPLFSQQQHTQTNDTKLYNIHMAEKLVNKGEILRRLC